MVRRSHPRLVAAHARAAESMRQAAQQLREEQGPVKWETRIGLARLLEAVADQQGTAGVYVWDGAAAIANALLAQPLDKGIGDAIAREQQALTEPGRG